MSTERDELAADIRGLGITVIDGPPVDLSGPLAQHLHNLGYRKPRTITTTEELDALLFEAVILDSYGTAYVCLKHAPTENQWDCPALTNENMPSWAIVDHGPFTVLHEGNAA